jgi:hypothetical protein
MAGSLFACDDAYLERGLVGTLESTWTEESQEWSEVIAGVWYLLAFVTLTGGDVSVTPGDLVRQNLNGMPALPMRNS